MQTAKIFKNGQSQAVRLPKSFRFDGDQVYIKKVGTHVILSPKINSWDLLLKSIDEFPEDWSFERDSADFKEKDLF